MLILTNIISILIQEDLCVSVAHVDTGASVAKIPVSSPTFSIAWHPKRYLLAYACDDKDKYDRDPDSGSLKVWGFPSDEWTNGFWL